MAAGVTLTDARAYFLGQSFTDEDANGKETRWTVTDVHPVDADGEAQALGFKDAAEAAEHDKWLDKYGSPEFKAWKQNINGARA